MRNHTKCRSLLHRRIWQFFNSTAPAPAQRLLHMYKHTTEASCLLGNDRMSTGKVLPTFRLPPSLGSKQSNKTWATHVLKTEVVPGLRHLAAGLERGGLLSL